MPPDASPAAATPAPSPPPSAPSLNRLGDVAAGAALGALLGLVMGLTTSPVASIVVSALVALLGSLFGLSDKLVPSFSGSAARRLAAFGIAAVIMIPTSIWMRVHEVLGVSVAEQRQMLKEIGIDDTKEQNGLLRTLRLGGAPAVMGAGSAAAAGNRLTSPTGAAMLYSLPSSFCSEVVSLRVMKQPAADFDRLFAASGEPQARLARSLATLSDAQRKSAFEAAADGLCTK